MVAAAGVKTTAMEQLEPAASVEGQVVVSAKLDALVPARVMATPVRVVLPLLVRVMLPVEDAVPMVLVRLRVVPESVAPDCSGVPVAAVELPPQPMMPKESERATTANLLQSIRDPIYQNLRQAAIIGHRGDRNRGWMGSAVWFKGSQD